MRIFLSLTLVLVNTSILTIGGSIMGFTGPVFWPLLSVVLHVGLYFLGDKIFLKLVNARISPETAALQEHILGRAYHLGLIDPRVYVSRAFPNNVYIAQAGAGPPSLVIGIQVLSSLRRGELLALINMGLISVLTGEAKAKTFLALAQLPLSLPGRLFGRYASSGKILLWALRPVCLVMDIYQLGLNAFYERLILNPIKEEKKRDVTLRVFDEGAALCAATQKIAALSEQQETAGYRGLIERMALVKRPTPGLAGLVFDRQGASA